MFESERAKEKRSQQTRINDTHTDTQFAVYLFNAIRIYIDVSVSNFDVSVNRRAATPTTTTNKKHTTNEKMHHSQAHQNRMREKRERVSESLCLN